MSEPKRLFFTPELPSAVQEQTVQWWIGHFPEGAGRPIAADNLHLTLTFLGEVGAGKQWALAILTDQLHRPDLILTLGDAGQWLRSQVVWLRTRQPPRGLLQLVNMLCAQAVRSDCYQSP